ncbi:MAG: hypothetical protein VR72_09245 [Clostridiaceae bacterium BRH_c20a]|nr:MAG: hypothetical protein VR72_09245 [Clostridiaceae bacterium BRH_c20a]
MTEDIAKGNGWRRFFRQLCFIAFGLTAFFNPLDRFNPANILFGIVVGLVFGSLCKAFLSGLLRMFNPDLKASIGRKTISHAVEKGMTFMVPFAVMALLATFVMGWSITGGFVSAGLMTAAASASMEIGKLKGKQAMKNTILTSAISWSFSTLWLYSIGFLGKMPAYIEGVVGLISSLAGNFLK